MIEKTETGEKTEKKYSINSAQTDFPMKANSAVRELEIQASWQADKVYEHSLQKRFDCPKFVLHDGPPYLSSPNIHIGTALNKILKDIVTKYKSIRGFYSPFVPGFDSHGLPIETAVVKDVKGGRQAMTALELRKRCREFALTNLKGQTADFKRLGIWGDWDHPYVTLDQKFEASQLRVFGKMAEAGYLYKGLKAVSWCANCETALAEAEVEYADHLSDAIYVRLLLDKESKAKLPSFAKDENEVSAVIWTTTVWTMPANVALAVNAEYEYDFIKTPAFGTLIVAKDLRDNFLTETGIAAEQVTILGTATGTELQHLSARHPFFDRPSPIILGEHVTAEAGTGVVHIAPGHGPEDFALGVKYKLQVISPVDGRGMFTKEAGPFEGMRYNKAIEAIIELLKQNGALIHNSKVNHSYPHCWRCKKPLIFRATEQWFASLESFREKALRAIEQVEWVPAAGQKRIYNMVEGRSEWCISRQRAWGVPIPAFYCASCGKVLLSSKTVEKVALVFENEGSDTWWEKEAKYFLGSETKCEQCGSSDFTKETDIMDVWFDSGTTHAAVLDQRPELRGTP
jgi:isoleucyl-tRNA synthetase